MRLIRKLIIPLLILCSCSNQVEAKLHNYDEIKDHLISWNEVFKQNEDDYLVYFYSETCGHCKELKQEIISFYLKDITLMYFVCTDIEAKYGPRANLLGIDNITDFYIFGTPFLLRLTNHIVSSYYVGKEEVNGYISILNN